jgi:hypothetical protein
MYQSINDESNVDDLVFKKKITTKQHGQLLRLNDVIQLCIEQSKKKNEAKCE